MLVVFVVLGSDRRLMFLIFYDFREGLRFRYRLLCSVKVVLIYRQGDRFVSSLPF